MKAVIKINKNTWRIEDGMVRFYLLCGSEKAALIDTGMTCPDAKQTAQEYAQPVNMFGNEVTLYKFDYAGFLYQK